MEKYTDKFLNDYKILSKSVLGFEIECYFNMSFYKVLELLNQRLKPVKIHGFRKYHSDFKPDENNFKLERDLSGGENMAEIITGPMSYFSAKHYLIKILKFIEDYGHTSDKSSIHFNLSFDDISINNLDILKQILNTDEEEIYQDFPSRKDNVYSKSIYQLIPFKSFDYSDIPIGAINNMIQIPDSKYYGINFQHINDLDNGRIEYRYIGGENYHKKLGSILEHLDRFIVNTYSNLTKGFTPEDENKLQKFLKDRISIYQKLSSYESFLVEYPNVELQINQDNRYEVVSTHYSKIYNKLFNFLEGVEGIDECILNFHTETNKIEVVESSFSPFREIYNIDFISCQISGGIISSSNLYDCKIQDSQISKSKIDNSTINKSKLYSCNVKSSELTDCFFERGFLDSYMIGGIFRSGRIGPFAKFSETTRIVGEEKKKNFFQTTKTGDDSKLKK
jgi:hypothetical protein